MALEPTTDRYYIDSMQSLARTPASIKQEIKEVFLQNLSRYCHVQKAAEAAGILCIRTLYNWRKIDPEFAEEYDEAYKIGLKSLEDEAFRRAQEGTEVGIYYQGELIDTKREFSDSLMMFLLKTKDPEQFSDRVRKEISGPGGGAIKIARDTSAEEAAEAYKKLLDSGQI